MKTHTRRIRFHALERAVKPSLSRVDREQGVIRGVKVLGTRSSNGRRYPAETIRACAHLYEGASVRLDHPDDPEDQRSVDSVIGCLRGVKVGNDGSLYADLHFLKSHPFTPRLLEAVEKNPRLYGLSHNATGDGETEDGVFVVREITEVRSVDLVADPATTQGLFESRGRSPRTPITTRGKTMTLKEWFQRTRLLPANRKQIKRLFERKILREEDEVFPVPGDDTEPVSADPPAEIDPADMDPEAALRQGFRAAMIAVIDDTTLAVKDKVARFKELVTTAERLLSSGEDIPEEEDLTDLPEMDDEELPLEECEMEEGDLVISHEDDEKLEEAEDELIKDKPHLESKILRRRLNRIKAREQVRTLCEAANYQPSKTFLKALLAVPAADRKALIEERKNAECGKSKPRTTAVLEGKRTVIGDRPEAVKSVDDFVRALISE